MTPEHAGAIGLVDLDSEAFCEYREHFVSDYAADKVRSGAWSNAESKDRAAKEVDGPAPSTKSSVTRHPASSWQDH